jgi:hypothetical protein
MTTGDCVVVQEVFVLRALDYYRPRPKCTMTDLDRAATAIPDASTVYVVLSHTDVKIQDVMRLLGREREGRVATFGNRVKVARLKPRLSGAS